ncbi:NTF2-like protein [Trichodelitschia bisporula]|uniref:mRNA export factor MEX67 n=1 Tax=Trichodelitschia bisporula TaxID=703511 RepID=A0A6G1I6L3_9PEZI|nr:NTF2-like protein [Trichodelitschia bisporula]
MAKGSKRVGAAKSRPSASKGSDVVMRDIREKAAQRRRTGPKGSVKIAVTGFHSTSWWSHDPGQISALVEQRISVSETGPGTRNTNGGVRKRKIKKNNGSKIRKPAISGTIAYLTVSGDLAPKVLALDGLRIKDAVLHFDTNVREVRVVEALRRAAGSSGLSEGDLKVHLTNTLSRRFKKEAALLDLCGMAYDTDLSPLGLQFAEPSSPLFVAMMAICDVELGTAMDKAASVVHVSLANNNIGDLESVATLAETFPELKSLDLSGNPRLGNQPKFPSLWKREFKKLETLVLDNGPLLSTADVRHIIGSFPRLLNINGIKIPDDLRKKVKGSLVVLPGQFKDDGGVGSQFLANFFAGYDNDRQGLVDYYYDDASMFSLVVNNEAARVSDGIIPKGEWAAYIHESRNLKKLDNQSARLKRKHVGKQSIRSVFKALPATQHPSLAEEPGKWMVECVIHPGVPDPTGRVPGGVNGLLITTHGEFKDDHVLNEAHNVKTRSFDRTFIIGPGSEPGSIRIISDMLVIRGFGGADAYNVGIATAGAAAPPPPPLVVQPVQQLTPQPEIQQPVMQQSDSDDAQKQAMVTELCRLTGLNVGYSTLCLQETGWAFDAALQAFQSAKDRIPPEAFAV